MAKILKQEIKARKSAGRVSTIPQIANANRSPQKSSIQKGVAEYYENEEMA